jgi:hypothetical protein
MTQPIVASPGPPGELLPPEYIWRDQFDWLKSRGYLLRRRYEPKWIPSWRDTKRAWHECEDSLRSNVSCLILMYELF